MPVDLLLCEGGANSPDLRVLKKLLSGYCGEIKGLGGKYGMGARILAHRDARASAKIAGLLDGDFQTDWTGTTTSPLLWTGDQGKVIFGWRWARKEIENYLIDPLVVTQAFGEAVTANWNYDTILNSAADAVAIYQAARTALSNCRRRFEDLPAGWGRPRGRDRHPFPDQLDEPACRAAIVDVVSTHGSLQAPSVDEVLERFASLLAEFSDRGPRRRGFLWTFAGKDLLLAMEAHLRGLGFSGVRAFREQILIRIENAGDDIAAWMPEWASLRGDVETF